MREFAKWAPQLNVVCFTGNAESRQLIRSVVFVISPSRSSVVVSLPPWGTRTYELKDKKDRVKFDVLLTSWDVARVEASALRSIDWQCLVRAGGLQSLGSWKLTLGCLGCEVVDEGHRLKNSASKLTVTLDAFKSRFRLLLTGTVRACLSVFLLPLLDSLMAP